MNEETANHARNLLGEGASPTSIFRYLLEKGGPSRQDHFHLVHDLQSLFDMSVDSLLMIGAWDKWKKNGYDDSTLDEKLKGRIKMKN
ncbi:hypothetical protein [Luteolibacter sp. LG18]|uniref:hypothetical protein n=1 Tax=Luteolibacter sp. LG18 TaxID=2819286 RepID=UPI002B2D6CF2|nr:hypothetical protein llg_26610 [Luteolibacter sp. LG18]